MLYSELAGLEVTLQDKNLVLAPEVSAQTNTVLCIAPIWIQDGSNVPPVDEGVNPSYEPVTIRRASDFAANGLGQHTTRNPLVRLWKQATDAGATTVKVLRLHGKTLEERYIGLHNIFSILGDYDTYDILVIGGVYANDECFVDISDAALKLTAQRQALLSAYNADEYVSYAEVEETINKTTIRAERKGSIQIALDSDFAAGATIVVAGKTVTFYANDSAPGFSGDDYGIDMDKDDTAAKQAAAIAGMTFAGFAVTNPEDGVVLFTETTAGAATLAPAVATGGTLVENEVTSAVIKHEAYVLSTAFAKLEGMIATSDGVTEDKFTYNPGIAETAYKPFVDVDVNPLPANIKVTYDAVEDAADIDKVDQATALLRPITTTISSADIGEGKLAVPSTIDGVTVWTVDLTSIPEFASWSGDDIVVYDNNGELSLHGVAWSLKNTETDKELVFYKRPANWYFVFNINSYFDFAASTSAYLDFINEKGIQVIGVMAVKPARDNSLRTIKEYIANVPMMQYTKNLQVVGGPEQIFQISSTIYKDTWQGAYAGLLAMLPSYEAPLNKPIPGVIKQDYQLSAMQSLTLTNKHIVVSRKRGPYVVCSDGVTTAEDNSDFVLVTTLRIVNDAVNLIKGIADPFIGKPNTIPMRAGLETSIKTGLDGMINAGAISDYRFVIVSSQAEQLEGKMRIVLELVPVFTVRKIRISVAVRPSL